MSTRDTPRLRVEQACERWGRSEVIRRCLNVLSGGTDDPELIVALGGAHARELFNDDVNPGQAYWQRVWAARGLLWAGPGAVEGEADVLRAALIDEAWRVREMTCKVVARHLSGDLLDAVAALESDPVPRVRAAAARSARRIVEARA